jgi:hypothetical protein
VYNILRDCGSKGNLRTSRKDNNGGMGGELLDVSRMRRNVSARYG